MIITDGHGRQPKGIALALSGGGVRAAAFHAGVLQYLAEHDKLEEIVEISSVSGGSLFTGLVYAATGYEWPSSRQYLEKTLPHVRSVLTTTDLQGNSIARLLLNPCNWRFILSRANVVTQSLKALWGIDATLGQIPEFPSWSINGTAGETGKRFRFKNGSMGDWTLGYAEVASFPLQDALAVSAAFPGGIGPLAVPVQNVTWKSRERYGLSIEPDLPKPAFSKLHLYDGGLYDNLGMEPFFDITKQAIKRRSETILEQILVSDGGAPVATSRIPSVLNPWRFKRMMDIMSDQQRALRVRSFVGFLQKDNDRGAYIQLGSNAEETIRKYGEGRANQAKLLSRKWLGTESVNQTASYPTNLKRMAPSVFDLLALNGYETAMWNLELFAT